MNGSHFKEVLRDGQTEAREGLLAVGRRRIKTPVLWLGHSLKDPAALWDDARHAPRALLVNAHDFLRRGQVLAAVKSQGVHTHLKYAGPIMMDSGGFMLQSRGELKVCPLQVAELYEEAGVEIGVALDHPLTLSASRGTNGRRWGRSLRNLELMVARVSSCAFMPVVHGYTLRALLGACIQVRAVFGEPPLVGLGSLVPLIRSSHLGAGFRYRRPDGSRGDHQSFVADAIKLVRDVFPNSFLHVFGVGGINTAFCVFALGADSVDSVAWRLKAAYGAIQLSGLSDRRLTPRTNSQRSRPVLQEVEKSILAKCRCPVCAKHEDVEGRCRELNSSFRARCTHNGWVLDEEMRVFRKALRRREAHRFIAGRMAGAHRFSRIIGAGDHRRRRER
ncbi:MAG TPA: hypothetical protein VE642_02775 [Pyrinomonadaceae bacterium]|jgi:queuine/archaeosine tRNA-ribosyltransferase|nr:hypothetical protein [Pyrinomonadaceae bacterium]